MAEKEDAAVINNNRNNNARMNGCGVCRGNLCRNKDGRESGCGDRKCREIMEQLRAVDFALTETVLYLNAYPHCGEAMNFYHKLVEQRRQLVGAYESQCGPLTRYGNDGDAWEWAEGPWPWEAEAN